MGRGYEIAYLYFNGEHYQIAGRQACDLYVKLLKEKGHEAKRVSKRKAFAGGNVVHSLFNDRDYLLDIEFCYQSDTGELTYRRIK